jgi:hypothetical protein
MARISLDPPRTVTRLTTGDEDLELTTAPYNAASRVLVTLSCSWRFASIRTSV